MRLTVYRVQGGGSVLDAVVPGVRGLGIRNQSMHDTKQSVRFVRASYHLIPTIGFEKSRLWRVKTRNTIPGKDQKMPFQDSQLSTVSP